MGQPKQDRPLFEGGPLISQVQSWKKQFGTTDQEGNVIQEGEIYLTQIGEDRFVWRPLNRYEYKEILALPNTDPLQREEIICQTCVLWPEGYNYEAMARGKAGIPALLAEQIMEASGFTNQLTPPTRL
jgi:hypothetical protein